MLNFIDIIKAVFLGLIEGLTEFIPVSSTAHLLLASEAIDFRSINNNIFEVVIQLGAILAICVLYRKKICDLIFKIKEKSQQKFILNIVLAFLPAVVLGISLHSFIKAYLFSNLVIAIALIVGGVLMIIVEENHKNDEEKLDEIDEIKPLTALFIGLFQCLAMIPGTSRSGATIIGGLLLGLNRKVATEFSFFLAIPTIAGASVYDFFKNSSDLTLENINLIAIGLLVSFFSALFVIKWFINFVSKHSFVAFGYYRILIGILVLLFIA